MCIFEKVQVVPGLNTPAAETASKLYIMDATGKIEVIGGWKVHVWDSSEYERLIEERGKRAYERARKRRERKEQK